MTLRVVTDFKNCPDRAGGLEIRRGSSFEEIVRELPGVDAVVINCTVPLVFRLVLYFLAFPWKRKPLIAVDLVLREARTPAQKVAIALKRLLFSRVDHFIHYFDDVRGYEAHYGIGPDRSSYVAFKVNIWGAELPPLSEEYVYTMGISQRDYGTFIRAMAELPGVPAAMPEFSFARFENRGADFAWTPANLPANLKLLPDTGSRGDLVRNLARARLVVIPTLKSSLCASGISTYLDAMYLGKCVIMSEGPGASDVLKDGQAALVPAEDPAALRDAIRRLWDDASERQRIAERGNAYARSLGGEAELVERVMARVSEVLSGKFLPPGQPLPR